MYVCMYVCVCVCVKAVLTKIGGLHSPDPGQKKHTPPRNPRSTPKKVKKLKQVFSYYQSSRSQYPGQGNPAAYVCPHVYVCMYACMYVCMYDVWTYGCMYVCTYVCS